MDKEKIYRAFHISSQCLSEEHILQCVQRYKTISKYAYILHDKDTYTIEDEQNNSEHKAGTNKPNHWHVAIKLTTNAVTCNKIAQWFEIPTYCVEGMNGRDSFYNCIRYMTHKTPEAFRKHKYNDDEIKSNTNWKEHSGSKRKRKVSHEEKMFYREQVLVNGMKPVDVQKERTDVYLEDFSALDKLRKKYFENTAEPPRLRINFLILGKGGSGKNLLSKAIARTLYPDIEKDKDIFFNVGKKNTIFDKYNGQNVIIWNDYRADELIKKLDGKETVFNLFDSHPDDGTFGIKYGDIKLFNEVNIINNSRSYTEFFQTLVGDEDLDQAYRRFPFIIEINKYTKTFDLFINKGFFFDDIEDNEYFLQKGIFFDTRYDAKLHDYFIDKCRINENEKLSIIKKSYDLTILNHSFDPEPFKQESLDFLKDFTSFCI